MRTISLKIPDDIDAKLKHLSAQRGKAKSDIVRAALENYFAERKNGAKLSCAELAGELIGCVSGPTDLATNVKHMRGYGK